MIERVPGEDLLIQKWITADESTSKVKIANNAFYYLNTFLE